MLISAPHRQGPTHESALPARRRSLSASARETGVGLPALAAASLRQQPFPRGTAVLSLQRALSNRHGLRGLDGVAGERTETHPPLSTTAWAIQREEDDGHELQSERFAGEPTLEACFDDKARLRPGDSGEPVRRLQGALIAVGLGDDLGPKGADGIYGAMTAATVRRFKRVQKLGFEQFGDAGPGTIGRLDSMLPKGSPKPPPVRRRPARRRRPVASP